MTHPSRAVRLVTTIPTVVIIITSPVLGGALVIAAPDLLSLSFASTSLFFCSIAKLVTDIYIVNHHTPSRRTRQTRNYKISKLVPRRKISSGVKDNSKE